MADELVAGRIENRHFALDDRDEGVAPVAHAVEHVTDVCSALLAKLGQHRQLRRGQLRTGGTRHRTSVPVRAQYQARWSGATRRLAMDARRAYARFSPPVRKEHECRTSPLAPKTTPMSRSTTRTTAVGSRSS